MWAFLKNCGKAFLIALLIGVAFAGLFALREGIWRGRLITWVEFVACIGITVLAFPIALIFDIRKRRTRDDPITGSRKPPDSPWADCCLDINTGSVDFERWVPVDGFLGTHSLEVEQVLEDRTWNHQRVILLVRGAPAQELPAGDLSTALREWCRANLRPSRLRGLAVGVVLDLGGQLSPDADALVQVVDGRARFPATVQWLVWVNRPAQRAAAARIWLNAATMPCFEEICAGLAAGGFAVDARVRQPSGVLKTAIKIDRAVPWWLKVLGP